jgi:hypothetical protein
MKLEPGKFYIATVGGVEVRGFASKTTLYWSDGDGVGSAIRNRVTDDARELLRVTFTPKAARAFGWALVNAATVADRHRAESTGPAPMNVHPLLGKVL